MPGWKRKKWIKSNGEPVINKDELLELEENMNLMDVVKWVKLYIFFVLVNLIQLVQLVELAIN